MAFLVDQWPCLSIESQQNYHARRSIVKPFAKFEGYRTNGVRKLNLNIDMNPKNKQEKSNFTRFSQIAKLHTSWAVGAFILATLSACGGGSESITYIPSTPVVVIKPEPIVNNTTLVNGLAINNFNHNDTVRYPLPLLYGLTQPNIESVKIDNGGEVTTVNAVNGVFKALIPLRVGTNEMTITTGSTSNKFSLNYLPADNPKKVKMMIAIPSDEEGRFLAEANVDNSLAAAKQKISLQALLMQSATAEMMHKAGKSHMTYALLEDGNRQPLVETLRLPLTRAELLKKTDNELYDAIAQTIRNTNYDANLKYMVTMSFSDYVSGKVVGHAALGGGYLGIFGSLHLHTCPNTLGQVNAAMMNTQVIDLKIFPDDSGGRMSYWANCATGMGASLHELGHTFDLPHTPTGIMSRGFDNFNRWLMMREPGIDAVITRDKEAGASWDPASVEILIKSDWIKK